MRSVTLLNATLIEHLIDGSGRRVGKKINGIITQKWLYSSDLRIVAELDSANNVTARFVYGTSQNVPDYIIKDTATYRIICDHLGSVRLVVDISNGFVAQRIDYDEFGNILTDTNPDFQPFKYAGGLYDNQTRLIRFGVRDYEPSAGRWTKKDPVGFEGNDENLYVYVSSDPINLIDPTGQWGDVIADVIFSIIDLAAMDVDKLERFEETIPEVAAASIGAAFAGKIAKVIARPLLKVFGKHIGKGFNILNKNNTTFIHRLKLFEFGLGANEGMQTGLAGDFPGGKMVGKSIPYKLGFSVGYMAGGFLYALGNR